MAPMSNGARPSGTAAATFLTAELDRRLQRASPPSSRDGEGLSPTREVAADIPDAAARIVPVPPPESQILGTAIPTQDPGRTLPAITGPVPAADGVASAEQAGGARLSPDALSPASGMPLPGGMPTPGPARANRGPVGAAGARATDYAQDVASAAVVAPISATDARAPVEFSALPAMDPMRQGIDVLASTADLRARLSELDLPRR
jgi:hypothetical protein